MKKTIYTVEHKKISDKGFGFLTSDTFSDINDAYEKANEYRKNGYSARVIPHKSTISTSEKTNTL